MLARTLAVDATPGSTAAHALTGASGVERDASCAVRLLSLHASHSASLLIQEVKS
ncbi:hypothetical protein [Roseateles asaccharophilus]|uniref:Uncharacterized protein n=1 Tax=Roseateles asaccharophilus TaxID=582607 RepID=A0ABU2AFQ6_9BURK|nr:hypothetical protein [Roseateles asaccharophilus]MDR7334788.1 hypothetical protein [Roseateles asaccharophilus]